MKMFKTMNKGGGKKKRKEKKELKKGTKKGLPNNLQEIYLFFTYIILFCYFISWSSCYKQRKHIYSLSYTEHQSSAVCEK